MSGFSRAFTVRPKQTIAAGVGLSLALLVSMGYCGSQLTAGPKEAPQVQATGEATPGGVEAPAAPSTTQPQQEAPQQQAPQAPPQQQGPFPMPWLQQQPTPEDTGSASDDSAEEEDAHLAPPDTERTDECSDRAAAFGKAYASGKDGTREEWVRGLVPFLSRDMAARIDAESVAFDLGQVPAGAVDDTVSDVDTGTGVCTARVGFTDGSTLSPTLRQAKDGRWYVVGMPELTVSGGQQAAPGPQPTIDAGGTNEFATPSASAGR